MQSKLPFIIIGAVLIFAIIGAVGFYKSRTPNYYLITKTGAPGAKPPHVRGQNGPAVTIEEFGDFQCPPCGKLHPILKDVEAKYRSRVALVFREFPMTQLHANALDAARAAEAAGLQKDFWEMHDFLYDSQTSWSDWKDIKPMVLKQAGVFGLDPQKLRRDMDSPEVQQRLVADQQRGQSLGVQGTPAVFLNGRLLAPEELNHLSELIEAALRQPSGAPPTQ